MWQLNLLLVIQVFLGMIIVLLLHKVCKLKVQVDEITKEVKDYISFIIEDEASSETDTPKNPGDVKSGDAMQSSLIQSVLGEFFP